MVTESREIGIHPEAQKATGSRQETDGTDQTRARNPESERLREGEERSGKMMKDQ